MYRSWRKDNYMKTTGGMCVTIMFIASIVANVGLARERNVLPILAKKLKPAVVAIITYYPNRTKPGLGSGFFIAPDQIVSARHNFTGGQWAEVRTADGAYHR